MTASKTVGGPGDDVEMAVGDRVERAGVDRDRVHRSSCAPIEGQRRLAEAALALGC